MNDSIIIKEIPFNIIEDKIAEKKSERKSASKSINGINGKTVSKGKRSLPYSPKPSESTKLKRVKSKWLGGDDVDNPVIDLSMKVKSEWSEYKKNLNDQSLMNKNNCHMPLLIGVDGIKHNFLIVEGEYINLIPHPLDENKNLMLIPTHTTDISN